MSRLLGSYNTFVASSIAMTRICQKRSHFNYFCS